MKTELVTSLKRQATRILADFHETKEPVLITENGQPSAYFRYVDNYEQLMTRMSILEGIARGEQAIKDGRVLSQSEAKDRLSKWMK